MNALAAIWNIPHIVVNVPISEEAEKEVLAKPNALWRWKSIGLYVCQAPIHRERLIRIGVAPDCIRVVGPISALHAFPKSERLKEAARWRAAFGLVDEDRPVIVAGSTHEADETVVLESFQRLRQQHPHAVLILAPRRLDRRFPADIARRSQGDTMNPNRIILLDTLGELAGVYAVADAAFVGGTFDPALGGHTPAEPLAWAVPTSMGPHYSQQILIVEPLLNTRQIQIVTNAEEMLDSWTSPQPMNNSDTAKENEWRTAYSQLFEELLSEDAANSG